MIRFLRFLVRRVFIFAIVAGLAYATVFEIFPFIDARMPLLLAVVVTYALMAYVVIPALIRLIRVFIKPNHVPTYCTTADGWASDPINIAVLARSKRDFVWSMQRAGWYVADDNTLKNTLREGFALLFDAPYHTAPFSNLYLFGRKQDIGFQIPVGNSGSPRQRHHVRFWRVDVKKADNEHEHHGFWRRLFEKFVRPRQSLWVGAAIYDAYPFAIRWRNAQLTHLVHPDADYERDFLIKTLQEAGVLKKVEDVKAGEPYRGRGQAVGMTVISDGFVKLCSLKRQLLRPKQR